MKENDIELFTYASTKGNLKLNTSSSQTDNISEKAHSNPLDDEQNHEFINQEIPVNINDISEIRNKT